MKTIYDKYILIEYAKDGWVSRIAIPKPVKAEVDYDTVYVTYEGEFDPSEDPIGRG